MLHPPRIPQRLPQNYIITSPHLYLSLTPITQQDDPELAASDHHESRIHLGFAQRRHHWGNCGAARACPSAQVRP
jgi:hypothetical protein